MAWAITDPNGMGDFFPAGEYIGWKEAVHTYFFNEMSDEEKRAMRPDMVLDYYEFAKKFSGNDGPLVSANCPSEYRMKKRNGSLGSLLHLTNRLRAVDGAMKELIEELEPGAHQFWPMRLTQPKGEEYPRRYYGMIIGRLLDSFLPEQSDQAKFFDHGDNSYTVLEDSKTFYAGIAMSAAVIGSTHLWRERRMNSPKIYISDELHEGIMMRGLRIEKHFKLKVV